MGVMQVRIKLRWIATALNVGVTAATASLDDRETSSSVAGETTNASPAEMDLPDGGLNGVAAGLFVRPVAAVCDRWL